MGGKTQTFGFKAVSVDRLWIAAVRAAGELGYTVLHSDQASRTLSFNTGRSMSSWAGQDLTMTLSPAPSGCNMILGGSLGKGGNPFGGGQAFAWGEKGRLIQTFATKAQQLLAVIPEPVAPSTDLDLAVQLEKLAALHAAEVLSDDEFGAAKARLLG